jgi:hypothetical protein
MRESTVCTPAGRGSFESHADRLDLRSLLAERAEEPDPLRHPSAWLGGGDADLPDPPRAL